VHLKVWGRQNLYFKTRPNGPCHRDDIRQGNDSRNLGLAGNIGVLRNKTISSERAGISGDLGKLRVICRSVESLVNLNNTKRGVRQ
jgi:hypothetical protein